MCIRDRPSTEWWMIQSQVNFAALEAISDLENFKLDNKKNIDRRIRAIEKAGNLISLD